MKKMIKVLGLAILAVSIFTACSDDDSSTDPKTYESIYVHWNGDSTNVSFENMATIDVDGEKAITLSKFITEDNIPGDSICTFWNKGTEYQARQLYSYKIVGEDGFSAGMKGYPNNIWDHMGKGFIMYDTRNVIFPDEQIDLAGAYNVKATKHIEINRKFDVIINDTINVHYDLEKMATESVLNPDSVMEDAIPLSSFITKAVEDSVYLGQPENLMYNFRSADDFGPSTDLTWTQLQTGYWLKTSAKTHFTDPALTTSRYKVKFIEKITAHE
jgi:hypothetical protein